MEKFDFDSKKYVLLLVLVCLVFFILIVKAFDYLPESEENSVKRQNNITIDKNYNSQIQNNNYSEEQTEQKQLDQSSGTFVLNESTISNEEVTTPAIKKETPKFEEIKAPAGVGLEPIEEAENASTAEDKKSVETEMTPQEKAELALMTGNKLKKMNDLKGALAEYQKVPELTKDKELVAESYEGIATLYAITKRYGTALNYASKAYNTAPNSSREMLLARLYYKTGDIDKATRRVNNVLHRDFSDDVK